MSVHFWLNNTFGDEKKKGRETRKKGILTFSEFNPKPILQKS